MTERRRFYKDVSVSDDLSIALDGRKVRTPLKADLRLPTQALAQAIADEWAAQGEKIDPSKMLFTRLANTAIDRVGQDRPRIAAEVTEYAGSDLVCYRAETPEALVRRHAAHWDPVVDWARTEIDAPFTVTKGILHIPQHEAALKAHAAAVAGLNDFEFAAHYTVMTMTGSALIALMLARQAIEPDRAWAAAHADEDYQIEQWGEDEEARERRAARHAEFLACCRFMRLSRA